MILGEKIRYIFGRILKHDFEHPIKNFKEIKLLKVQLNTLRPLHRDKNRPKSLGSREKEKRKLLVNV